MKNPAGVLLLATLLCVWSAAGMARESAWLNAVSFSAGHSNGDSDTKNYVLGLEKNWRHSWFNGGAWYLGGYWETELSTLQADTPVSDKIYGISLTPVLRFQRDARLSSGVTPFAEAGIGAHLLSDTQLGNTDFATAFQFGSVIGIGVGFGERGQYEFSYRYTHLTNADIKKPNDGLDMHLLKLGYNFN